MVDALVYFGAGMVTGMVVLCRLLTLVWRWMLLCAVACVAAVLLALWFIGYGL